MTAIALAAFGELSSARFRIELEKGLKFLFTYE